MSLLASALIWGANIETGNAAEIATNTILSRPSFSPNDTKMLADAQDDTKIHY